MLPGIPLPFAKFWSEEQKTKNQKLWSLAPFPPVFRPRSRRALAFSDRRVVVFWFGVLIGPTF